MMRTTIMILDGILTILNFIFNGIEYVIDFFLQKSIDYGKHDASFHETPKDIYALGHTGLRIGRKAINTKESPHVTVVGITGSGKSTSSALCHILSKSDASFIIRDVSGELLKLSSGWLEQSGVQILVWNLSSAAKSNCSFNSLALANTTGELNRLAETFIKGTYKTSGGDSTYWVATAKEFLVFIFQLLKAYDEKYQNFFNVKYLIDTFSADSKALDRLVVKTRNEDLLLAYKSIIKTPEKTLMGTVTTLKSALISYIDHELCLLTAQNNFSFTDFRTHRVALFLQSNVLDDEYLNVIQSLFFTAFLNSVMQEIPPPNSRAIQCLIDEASSLTLGSILESATVNMRKYKCNLYLFYQSEQQVARTYGKEAAQAILANTARVYFPGLDIDTAQRLENQMGKTQIEDETGKFITQSLMNAQHIRQLERGKAILLVSNHSPLIVNATPYYKIWKYRKRSELAPYDVKSNSLSNDPTLLKKIPLTPEFSFPGNLPN